MKIQWGKAVILLFLCFCINILSEENKDSNNILKSEFQKQLNVITREINSIECDFRQKKKMDFLAEDAISYGKFYYALDKNKKSKSKFSVCLNYTEPMGNQILMVNGRFYVKVDGKTVSTGTKINPAIRQLNTLFEVCLTGDMSLFTKMEKESTIEISKSDSLYVLKMYPVSKSLQKRMKSITMHFDSETMLLKLLRMEEPNGDNIEYQFSNITTNRVFPENIFHTENGND